MTEAGGRRPSRRRGRYGVDGPGGVAVLGTVAGGLLALGALGLRSRVDRRAPAAALALGTLVAAGLGTYLHSSLRGKLLVWDELLAALRLRGDERVLDLGCGRGAVLLAAAKLVPDGLAVGVDVWRRGDQSGNDPRATLRNARLEGVADRVRLHTADMCALPFAGASFDVVVSSLAIHNVFGAARRRAALAEAARVLRPGGRVVIVDVVHSATYARELARLGLVDVRRRPLGPRFWLFGPATARAVTATAPAP